MIGPRVAARELEAPELPRRRRRRGFVLSNDDDFGGEGAAAAPAQLPRRRRQDRGFLEDTPASCTDCSTRAVRAAAAI